jgi:hypothetical protein
VVILYSDVSNELSKQRRAFNLIWDWEGVCFFFVNSRNFIKKKDYKDNSLTYRGSMLYIYI